MFLQKKLNILNIKCTNDKNKKNQLLCKLESDDGIDLKKLVPLIEQWHETINGEWATRDIELTINVKENERD